MDWKQSLDKWLTSEPDDGFDGWAEQVINNVSDNIYTDNEEWFDSEECDEMLMHLYRQDFDIIYAASEIEQFLIENN